MNVTTLERHSGTPRPGVAAGFPEWLAALSSGTCTAEEVLAQVQRLEEADPDIAWECLAHLDQQFRRKRVSKALFTALKGRLQQHSLGTGTSSTAAMTPPAPTLAPAEPPAPLAAAPRVGDVLRGRYRLVDLIIADDSGTLFEALDELHLGTPDVRPRVALRVIPNNPAQLPQRLRRLASVQALSHPGIARIFNVDEERGVVFVTMELPRGGSLRQLLDQTNAPLVTATAVSVVRHIAAALRYAHSQGVHHGDVRAEHVCITPTGQAILGGFEIFDPFAASVDGDRLSFAWFAYGLLSAKPGALRAPRGLTLVQWRALRDTLTDRKTAQAASLLNVLAGDEWKAPRQAPPTRQYVSSGLAIAVVIAIFAASGTLLMREASIPARPDNSTVTATALVPPTAVAAEPPVATASLPATVPVIDSTPVDSPRVYTHARMDFPTNFTEVASDEPVARIWVRRQGRMSAPASIRWWTESGTALPDSHFRKVEPRIAEIPGNARGVELLVPLVRGMALDRPRTFYVRIDEPDARSTLGEQVLMQVVIVPSEGAAAR